MSSHDLGDEGEGSGKSVWYPSRGESISDHLSPTKPRTSSLTLMRHRSGVPSLPEVCQISSLCFEKLRPFDHHLAVFIQRIAMMVAQSTVDSIWSASSASFTDDSLSVLPTNNAIQSFHRSIHPSHGWGRRFNPCRAHHPGPLARVVEVQSAVRT